MLSTRTKILLAKLAFEGIMLPRKAFGLGSEVKVPRGGLRWHLDLREGIDLAIYLFGAFERQTVRAYSKLVGSGDVVLDIGANVGAHTLYLARLVGEGGKVIAFEPTTFAFKKLLANIELNPDLISRITPEQVMLIDQPGAKAKERLYSSWPLHLRNELHKKHLGRLMETNGATSRTVDEYVSEKRIKKIDFIKMDVDGHECNVLRGGLETIRTSKPTFIMELAPYVLQEEGESLDGLLELFRCLNYVLVDLRGKQQVPIDPLRVRQIIPDGSSLNVLARPS